MRRFLLLICFAGLVTDASYLSEAVAEETITLEDHIRAHIASREEVRVFLDEMSWAQFDPDVGCKSDGKDTVHIKALHGNCR